MSSAPFARDPDDETNFAAPLKKVPVTLEPSVVFSKRKGTSRPFTFTVASQSPERDSAPTNWVAAMARIRSFMVISIGIVAYHPCGVMPIWQSAPLLQLRHHPRQSPLHRQAVRR